MGKKHKKHKRDWHHSEETADRGIETPLKLILKRGTEGTYDSDYADSPSSHHHRKKKKHSSVETTVHHVETIVPSLHRISDESSSSEVTMEEISKAGRVEDIQQKVKERQPKETARQPMAASKRKALNTVLFHLLKQLERKDPNEIFKWPVNDIIAPGYSDMISSPMDFSTMKNKIITNQYFGLDDMKQDVEQMVENCCIYNKEDTIYYEMAKKLLSASAKIFSKYRLASILRSLSATGELTQSEASDILGEEGSQAANDCSEVDVVDKPISKFISENRSERNTKMTNMVDADSLTEAISFTDADDALSVAPNVLEAAREAKLKLQTKNPNGKLGVLMMDKDGKMTLKLLNPDNVNQQSNEVDMGVLTGSTVEGIDVMPVVKEDKRNKVTPLDYLSYGAFGSFGPSYDSRISNLTQEESDLLLSAYSGETGYLFAQSIQNFVSDCNKGLVTMVSDMLDNVTHGAHTQTTNEILEKRKVLEVKNSAEKDDTPKIDFDELRSLKDLGIDVSFVDSLEATQKQGTIQSVFTTDIAANLDRSGRLIHKLKYEQQKRLSKKTEANEPNLDSPSTKEIEMAGELRTTFAGLAANVKPKDLVSVDSLHKAMGVSL